MNVITSDEFYKRIKDILNLPSNCKSVDIKLSYNSLVTVSVCFDPTKEQCEEFITIIKDYELKDKII